MGVGIGAGGVKGAGGVIGGEGGGRITYYLGGEGRGGGGAGTGKGSGF